MISNLFKAIWEYFDVICFLAAIAFAIWGFFLLNFVAGIFSIAVGLVLIGYLSERLAAIKPDGR